MTIWYIHGANNTDASFNWIIDQLPNHDHRTLTYSSSKPIWGEVERLAMIINGTPGIIIGHSLGGMIALALSHIVETEGVITLAAPFGGSEMAGLLSWMMPSELFKTVHPRGSFVKSMTARPRVPVLGIVARSPVTSFSRPNDGIVTVSSQMAVNGIDYVVIPTTHSEILLNPMTINLIKEFALV